MSTTTTMTTPTPNTTTATTPAPKVEGGVFHHLNRFYWTKEPEITTDQTSSRRIKPGTLLAFRIVSIFLSLATLIAGLVNSPATYFAYISSWAVAATMVTFLTLSISHVCQVTRRFSITTTDFEELAKMERYEMRMFKAANVLFEVTFTAEIVIAAVFWGLVYPRSEGFSGVFEIIDGVMVYAGMLALLTIEYVIHRMKFHARHFTLIVQVLVFYMLVHLAFTSFGFDAYSSVSEWSALNRLLFVSIATFLSLVTFFILKWFEDLKEKRVFKKDDKMVSLLSGVPALGSNYTQL